LGAVLTLKVFLLALLLAPYWETKRPQEWSDAELQQMFEHSPWGQQDGITVYFSTAKPMRDAEAEKLRRAGRTSQEFDADTEYEEFLKDKGGEYIAVSVLMKEWGGLDVPGEMERVQKECQLRSGNRRLKLTALFPPTPAEKVLRLIFPRELDPKAPKIRLELYVPASDGKAWRTFDFPVSQMAVAGRPAY
jgi:hypothetical protein